MDRIDSPALHRWSREQFGEMFRLGILTAGDCVELVGGQIVRRPPENPIHAVTVCLIREALSEALFDGFCIRPCASLALGTDSALEADLAVVSAGPGDLPAHPPAGLRTRLVVEVAGSSLEEYRQTRGSLYARDRIAEFWIVNLADRLVEVLRHPIESAGGRFGWRYAERRVLRSGETLRPRFAAGIRIPVSNLLP